MDDREYKRLLRKVKYERTCKYIQKPSRYEFNDPTKKQYWKKSVDELEEQSRESAKGTKIGAADLSVVLPPHIRSRVSKIIPVIPLSEDRFEEAEEIKIPEDYFKEENEELGGTGLTAETIRKMTQAQLQYDADDNFTLQIEDKPKQRPPMVFASNWMADYFKKPDEERIVWRTKLYAANRKFEDKSLFEQVEELTDLSAKSFVQWLNELGQEKSDVTEEMVKKFFSIGIEEGVSKSMQFGSTYVGAVSDNLANYWGLPQKGLEATIAKEKKKEQLYRSKATKPCEMFDDPEIIPPVFREVRTFERTFKGITNLASIGLLIDHLKANPEIERPKYLKEKGLFRPKKKVDESKKNSEKPLYELAQ